ncbi:putative aldouronate transport system permease protein [Paenibacillus phyllosphaerae]|uniref:Putative aldouronate transport system permease protein n=1 Tax=Paenibacillus phyllosphaerae TaxID=274593 RepID=A0A7W5ASU0_9BACL|nr:carbohydrate ABC transporter permease [Paenibacillus phyllosphaerae]MBB3108140.1 putative aldouronate transport system permease protein [Paenibacillus phyllosphaerae]
MQSMRDNNKLNASPVFTTISYTLVGLIALICLIPFIVLVAGSFSSETSVLRDGYWFWPRELSLDAYQFIFRYPGDVLQAYKVSLIITVVGTAVSLFISSMTAYVLCRKELKYRNGLTFFLFFTTLFSGGLAPFYIWISKNLHMQNTYLVLILAPMFNVMYILILRAFIQGSVPEPLIESAKIDGAGDLRIFLQMVLPLTKPALASIGVFTALAYWNDWWTAMMFTSKESLVPLQYLLYKMLSSINLTGAMAQHIQAADQPKETFKLAMTVIATGPVVLVFPFVQRYFVSGITIGAVKG